MSQEETRLQLVDFVEVFEFVIRVGNDRVRSRFPPSRADFSMLVGVLECLDQPEGFVDRPTNRQIVHRNLSQYPLSIDDEKTPERVAGVFEEDSVVLGDLVRQVGEKWDIERPEAAILARSLDPSQMSELRVDRHAHHLGVDSTELFGAVAESNDLRRADESEVQWIKEEDEIFALVHL